MSGSTFRTTKAQIHISPAAIKYISRHPNSSPTQPLTTLEANIPVSRPEITTPTLRPLCSGREYWEAMGTNIWGIMEQTPVTKEAAQTV